MLISSCAQNALIFASVVATIILAGVAYSQMDDIGRSLKAARRKILSAGVAIGVALGGSGVVYAVSKVPVKSCSAR